MVLASDRLHDRSICWSCRIFSRFLFHPLLSAAITYAFTLWFTGFHHLDGLIDVGDAMMVHSTPEKE